MKKTISLFCMMICSSLMFAQLKVAENGNVGIGTNPQNEAFVDSKTINGTNIVAGHHVTDTKQHGNVVIRDGSSVVLNSTDDVTLEDGFEVELGGSLEINN